MATFNFQLIDLPGDNGKGDSLPYGPRAYIGIKCSSIVPCPSSTKGIVELRAVSSECVNSRELNGEIDRLIKELRTLKKSGEKFFQKEGASK